MAFVRSHIWPFLGSKTLCTATSFWRLAVHTLLGWFYHPFSVQFGCIRLPLCLKILVYTYIVLEASCTYHFGESLSSFLVSKWVHLRTKEASEIQSTPVGKWSGQSWWGTGFIQIMISPRRYGNQSIFTSLATMRRAPWWGTCIINVRLTHGGFNLNSPLGSFQMQAFLGYTIFPFILVICTAHAV